MFWSWRVVGLEGVCGGFGWLVGFFTKSAWRKWLFKTMPRRAFTSLASAQLHLGFWSWERISKEKAKALCKGPGMQFPVGLSS